MNTIQGIQYIVNESPDHGKVLAFLSPAETAAVQTFHEALPEYARKVESAKRKTVIRHPIRKVDDL